MGTWQYMLTDGQPCWSLLHHGRTYMWTASSRKSRRAPETKFLHREWMQVWDKEGPFWMMMLTFKSLNRISVAPHLFGHATIRYRQSLLSWTSRLLNSISSPHLLHFTLLFWHFRRWTWWKDGSLCRYCTLKLLINTIGLQTYTEVLQLDCLVFGFFAFVRAAYSQSIDLLGGWIVFKRLGYIWNDAICNNWDAL